MVEATGLLGPFRSALAVKPLSKSCPISSDVNITISDGLKSSGFSWRSAGVWACGDLTGLGLLSSGCTRLQKQNVICSTEDSCTVLLIQQVKNCGLKVLGSHWMGCTFWMRLLLPDEKAETSGFQQSQSFQRQKPVLLRLPLSHRWTDSQGEENILWRSHSSDTEASKGVLWGLLAGKLRPPPSAAPCWTWCWLHQQDEGWKTSADGPPSWCWPLLVWTSDWQKTGPEKWLNHFQRAALWRYTSLVLSQCCGWLELKGPSDQVIDNYWSVLVCLLSNLHCFTLLPVYVGRGHFLVVNISLISNDWFHQHKMTAVVGLLWKTSWQPRWQHCLAKKKK